MKGKGFRDTLQASADVAAMKYDFKKQNVTNIWTTMGFNRKSNSISYVHTTSFFDFRGSTGVNKACRAGFTMDLEYRGTLVSYPVIVPCECVYKIASAQLDNLF